MRKTYKAPKYSVISCSYFNKAIMKKLFGLTNQSKGSTGVNFKKDFPKAYIFSKKHMPTDRLDKVDSILINTFEYDNYLLNFRFLEIEAPTSSTELGSLNLIVEISVDTKDKSLPTSVTFNLLR